MRILLVSDELPWPPSNGYRMRVKRTVDALTGVADVDLFVACDVRDPDDRAVPADAGVRRSAIVDRPVLHHGPLDVARWAIGRRPRHVVWRDWRAVAAALDRFVAGPYDLVWFSHSDVFGALRRRAGIKGVPCVVDFADIESAKVIHRVRSGADERAAAFVDRIDAVRWRRLERKVAATASTIVVCSDVDARRMPSARHIAVIPNAYDLPATEEPAVARRDGPPTALFVGLLYYPPNADAVRLLIDEIWPAVRARVPDARLRIVGDDGGRPITPSDGVDVVGRVDDLAPELALAHVAPVPIRFGGGTRIKLLEAMANRVAVVATTVAAEGIDVVDGEHARITDDIATFAEHVATLLTDADARAHLTDAAHQRWQERYRGDRVIEQIRSLVARICA